MDQGFVKLMVLTLLILIFVTTIIPVAVICIIGSICLFGADGRWIRAKVNGGESIAVGIYSKLMQSAKSTTEDKVLCLTITLTCRVGCLLLMWLVISLCLPGMKSATLLGLIHWKWSFLALLASFGYPYIYIYTLGIANFAAVDVISEARSAYYFIVGLVDSTASMIYAVFLFVVWMLYFHHHLQGSAVDMYTTRTLAMVMVGAFLWVLKTTVVLRWKRKAIYSRFRDRILINGLRLFLLIHILDFRIVRSLVPWRYKALNDEWVVIDDPHPKDDTDYKGSCKGNIQERIILSTNVSLKELMWVTEYLTDLVRDPLRDDDKQICAILDIYRQKIGPKKYVTEEEIRRLVNDELLLEMLQAEYPSKEMSQVPFEKWVVDAHKSCVSVGYTLIDAFAMSKVLNMILTWCLIVVVILLWLLVTELATTKVLMVIGSPFLALTFVFEDTCKTFFQGFIFAFINRPLNIGDRCIIDGVEVEVKRINITTTTCLKIGTKEKMLHPNSDLATKLIVILEDKPDPTDQIELVLDSSTKPSQITKLQEHIENFLNSGKQHEFIEKSCRVVVKEMRNDIKITVYFQHAMNIAQDVSHSRFLEKKETRRSKLILEIKQFLDDFGMRVATP